MELNNDSFLLKSYSNNLHKINEPSKSNDTKIKYDPDDNDEDEDDGNDDDDDDEDNDKDNGKNRKCECKVRSESSKKFNEFILKLPISDEKLRKKSEFSLSSKSGYSFKDGSEIGSNNSAKSSQIFQAASSNQCSSRNLPLNDLSFSTSAALCDPIYTKIERFEPQEKLKNKNKIKSISLDSPSITLIDCEQSNESLIEPFEYDLNEKNQSNAFNASRSCDLAEEQEFGENFSKTKNNIKSISLDSSRSLLTDADEQQINQNKSELHPNYSVIIIDDNIDTYKNSRSKSRIDSEMFNHKISSISMPATPLKNFLLLEQQQKHQQSSKNLQLLKLNKSSSLSNNNLKTLPEILNDFYIQDLDENLTNDTIEPNSKNHQEPSTSGHCINKQNKNLNSNSKSDLNFENHYNFNLTDTKTANNDSNDIDTNLKTKLISKSNYNLNNTLNINHTEDFNGKTNLSKSSLNLNLNNMQKQNSQINLLNSKSNSNNPFTLSSTILMPAQIAIQSNQNNGGKKNLLQRRGSNTSLTLNLNKNKANSGSCCYLNNRFSNSYNSLNLSATHFQQQQQQQQQQPNQTINHQHQQHKFGGFQPNSQKLIKPLSSLSLYQKQGSMITPTSNATAMNMSKKKGLLERRNSNTSLTLNLQQQQSYQNYKQQIGLSISNYNLNSSSSSLNSINSNDFQQQQQQQSQQDTRKLQSEHEITSDFQQNSEYFNEIKNKRKFSARKDSMQSKTMDDNDDNDENNQFFENCGTESNQSHNYQQRRKFLSSDGLNKIPQYSRLNQAHIRNLSKTCFGSVSDLKPTMIKSRNSDLNLNQFENSLNYTKPLQEDNQFRKSEINLNEINNFVMDTNASNYGFFDSTSDPNSKFKFHTNLCSCTGMRNITTRPLSPQSTSEDFKIYLANIQLLQNATNQLNYEKLKKFKNIFDNLFNAEESCEEDVKAGSKTAARGNENNSREEAETNGKKFTFKDNTVDVKFTDENKSNGKQFNFSKQELMNLNSSHANPLENVTSKNTNFGMEPINREESLAEPFSCKNEASSHNDYEKQKAEQKMLICQLHQEFWDLPTNYQEKPFVFNSQSKNRYRTILPNEHSRFQFKVNEFIVTNNKFHLNQEQQHHQEPYINANYIKGPDNTTNCYVAAQGPMSNTLYEHWLMVLQNLINFNQKLIKNNKDSDESTKTTNNLFSINLNQKIIMLTNFYESNRQKCSIYFPINLNQMILINNSNDLIDITENDLYKFYENHLNSNLDSDQILDKNPDTDDDSDGTFSLNKISFTKCIIQQNNVLYHKLIKLNNYFIIKNVHINDLNDFSARKFQCLFIQTLPIKGKRTVKSNSSKNMESKENYVKKSLDMVLTKNFELKLMDNDYLKNSNTDSNHTSLAIKLIIKKFQCEHYWYPNWPDHCSPNNIKSLLEMCTKILNNNELETRSKHENKISVLSREQTAGPCTSKEFETAFNSQCSNLRNLLQFNFHDPIEQPLPIIHCSAGIGRTGCLAAILNGIKQIHSTIDYHYLNKNKINLNSIQSIFDKLKINDRINIENNLSDFKTRINPNSINKNFNQNSIEFKNFILKNICVDILAIVCNLRLQRGGMVQNSEQYELIHRAVCLYVKCLEENLEKSF